MTRPSLRLRASAQDRVTFSFDGAPIEAQRGESVASALFASGIVALRRSPADGTPRGPFCLMGVCQECLVQIDGVTTEACRRPVADGLAVTRVP